MVLLYLVFSSPRSDPGKEYGPGVVAPVEASSQSGAEAEAFSRERGPFDDQSTIDTNPKSDPDSGQQSMSLGKPDDSISAPVLAEKPGESGIGAVEKKTAEAPSNLSETSGN